MKLHRLLLLGIGLIFIAGCSMRGSKLLIISAVYGSGTSFADVTARVNDLLHQPEAKFDARPGSLKADPAPGWNKALVIVYEFEGRRHIFTAGEGGKVSVDALVEQAGKKPRKE